MKANIMFSLIVNFKVVDLFLDHPNLQEAGTYCAGFNHE